MKFERTPFDKFVCVWQSCNTRNEVAAELQIPLSTVCSKGALLRKVGVKIKKLQDEGTKDKLPDVAALNALIEQLEKAGGT